MISNAMEVEEQQGERKKKPNIPQLIISMPEDIIAKISERSSDSPNSQSGDKIVPTTAAQLCDLVRTHSAAHKLPERRMQLHSPKSAEVSDESISASKNRKNVSYIDPLEQAAYEKYKQEVAKAIAEKVHVGPDVLVESRFKLHGELQKTPRQYEKDAWQKKMDKDPEKYDTHVLDLLEQLLERVHDVPEAISAQQDEEVADKFVDTHVGMLRNHIDEQNKFILIYKTVCVLCTIISLGASAWASYTQATDSSGGNSTAT